MVNGVWGGGSPQTTGNWPNNYLFLLTCYNKPIKTAILINGLLRTDSRSYIRYYQDDYNY